MKYRIIFLVLIFQLSFSIFHLPSAGADGLSLSISPSLLKVQTIPPADAKAPLTLENPTDNSVNVQVIFKPFRASSKENGEIEFIKDNEMPDAYKTIFSRIHVTDNGIVTTNFELAPKQKKNLELQFTIPKNEAESDYYFSVIFLARRSFSEGGLAPSSTALPNETGSFPDNGNAQYQNYSIINAGIAVNVLLSIGEKNPPQGAVEEFTAPSLLKSGPVNFNVRIKNTGSHVISPKAIIFIKNMFGQTVGRVDIEPDNILAGSIRTLTDSQTATTSSNFSTPILSGSTQKAIWPERFLLGPYTATLNLAVSDKGPVFNQTIVFLALPIQLILGAILGIIFIIIIFHRVRYRLKNDK